MESSEWDIEGTGDFAKRAEQTNLGLVILCKRLHVIT